MPLGRGQKDFTLCRAAYLQTLCSAGFAINHFLFPRSSELNSTFNALCVLYVHIIDICML